MIDNSIRLFESSGVTEVSNGSWYSGVDSENGARSMGQPLATGAEIPSPRAHSSGINQNEFLWITASLLSRMGYATDLERLELQSANHAAKKIGKWYERISLGVRLFTEAELPGLPVNIPLEKFSEQTLANLRSDWKKLTHEFVVSGLRFWHGKPAIFCGKVIQNENVNDLEELFSRKHHSYRNFAEKYPIALSENGYNVCVLCLAFADNEAFQQAKSKLRNTKGGFWKGTYTFSWLLNMNTLELATTKGFSPVHLKALEKTALFLRRNPNVGSLEAWKAPSRFMTGGLLGPEIYMNYLRFYLRLRAQAKASPPDDF